MRSTPRCLMVSQSPVQRANSEGSFNAYEVPSSTSNPVGTGPNCAAPVAVVDFSSTGFAWQPRSAAIEQAAKVAEMRATVTPRGTRLLPSVRPQHGSYRGTPRIQPSELSNDALQ